MPFVNIDLLPKYNSITQDSPFLIIILLRGFGPFSGHGLPDLLPPSYLLLDATVHVYRNALVTPQTLLQIVQTDASSLLFNVYQGFFCRGKVTEARI
jgi:hypothetical protein